MASPRPATAGDTVDTQTPARVEHAEIDRASQRSQTRAAMALGDVLAQHAQGQGGSGHWLHEIQALIAGASPDEKKALRQLLVGRASPVAGLAEEFTPSRNAWTPCKAAGPPGHAQTGACG